MAAVVISRAVSAGPRDPLPPGAAEAEFAYHMARLIKGERTAPIGECAAQDRLSSSPVFVEPEKPEAKRIAKAERLVETLKEMRCAVPHISMGELQLMMGISRNWLKRMKSNGQWRVVRENAGREPKLFDLDDVIASAQSRADEIKRNTKRK